jgi:hypothetical protein
LPAITRGRSICSGTVSPVDVNAFHSVPPLRSMLKSPKQIRF